MKKQAIAILFIVFILFCSALNKIDKRTTETIDMYGLEECEYGDR